MTDAESITEVIRRALAVYETLINHSADRHEIIIRTGDSEDDEMALILVP